MSTAATRRLTVLALGTLLVALTASACGGSVTRVVEGSSLKPTPQGAVPALGGVCKPADIPAGLSTQHVMSGGQRRTVVVYYPHGRHPGKSIPMVLDLHGSGSTPLQQLSGSNIATTADKNGFAVVAPQAGIPFIAGKSHGFAWNVPGVPLMSGRPVPKGAPNDMQFIRDTVADMGRQLCADPKRTYVTGFSGGARMASQVGCEMSGQIAAIAPMSGLRMPGNCTLAKPVSVLTFHGTSDGTNPYNGSKQLYWSYSVPVAAQLWGNADGCAKPVQKQVVNGVMSTTYSGCKNGREVVLYTVTGQRHVWPGIAGSMAHGYALPKIDPNEIMWDFFAAHPLDGANA
jgi:polyhydroxybutyrate depolymerase